MDTKDKISISLKEYDSLRKEIEIRTDGTKTYGWPVILLALGAITGWKTNLDVGIIFLFVPTVAMTIAALITNANFDMYRYRIALIKTEERINVLAGEKLLLYENSQKEDRKGQVGLLRFCRRIIIIYLIIEINFYFGFNVPDIIYRISGPQLFSVCCYHFAFVLILSTPLVIFYVNSQRWIKAIRMEAHTE